MGASLLLWLASCGGRSVAHEEAAAGAPSTGDPTAKPTTSARGTDCASLCDLCDIADQVNAPSCARFCDNLQLQATDAGCAPLLDNLVRCRNKDKNGCSLTACPNETNTFTVCVLTYCDSRPGTPLCSAW